MIKKQLCSSVFIKKISNEIFQGQVAVVELIINKVTTYLITKYRTAICGSVDVGGNTLSTIHFIVVCAELKICAGGCAEQ